MDLEGIAGTEEIAEIAGIAEKAEKPEKQKKQPDKGMINVRLLFPAQIPRIERNIYEIAKNRQY